MAAAIEAAAKLVRKPAISLQAQLDFGLLPNCGENIDIDDVQKLLQNAVASISSQLASNGK